MDSYIWQWKQKPWQQKHKVNVIKVKNCCASKHYWENAKDNLQNGREYLQVISLRRIKCPEYINNFYNLTTKKQSTHLKIDKGLE